MCGYRSQLAGDPKMIMHCAAQRRVDALAAHVGARHGVRSPSPSLVKSATVADSDAGTGTGGTRVSAVVDAGSAALSLSKAEVYALRKRHFCDAQSVSYENTDPFMCVRGERQYLYDETGAQYLDTRNNVAHVGHSHPRVAAAVSQQVSTINTNSRYLHPNRVRLAERLAATFPPALSVVFFVNSGSEANDLALRLARAHSGHTDAICVEHGYHGHTESVIRISPYKYEHEGGPGEADWVQKVECPDMYRGRHAGEPPARAAELYAAQVGVACARAGGGTGKVAAFFVESGMSVAGVIMPPPGYLRHCYAHVRAAGGVCVADEVQTGMGRLGDYFWAFEQQGVVPDVVTVGKPFGNGMPLAAVVCTRAVAGSFHNGLEYFNTFGGNPVCCAAGLAVLQVIEDEGLQAAAARTGRRLRAGFEALARQPHGRLVGQVRGCGLFVGVELVRDRGTREPASAETSAVCSRMKDEHRILMSIDGPHDSVLVMKPPLCFGERDADRVVACIAQVLKTLGHIDPHAERTPT
eukprot:g5057.t1